MAKLRISWLPPDLLLRRFALAYLVIWVLSPPLSYGLLWRLLALLAIGVWLLLELASSRSVLLRPNLIVLGAVALAFYTAMIEWIVPDAAPINRHFQVWMVLFFLLVGESFRRGREGDARLCFWLVLLLLPLWSLMTLYGLETMGTGVARRVTRSSAEAIELTEQGIGGFSLVYTIVLCLPFLFYFSVRPQSLVRRIQGKWARRAVYGLLMANVLLGGLLVLRAGYTIALMLATIVVAVLLLVRSRRLVPLTLTICLSGLLVLGGGLALGPILNVLQAATEGTEYGAKVQDLQVSLEQGESAGTVEGRTERYVRSAGLFLKNPVLGTLKFDDVGKHSAILDRFAQYGFGFGLLFAWLLLYVPLRMITSRHIPIGLALAFLAVAIGLPMLNNIFMSWGVALYLFSQGALSIMGLTPESRAQARTDAGRVLGHA